MTENQRTPTTLRHGKLPFPAGTLVQDTVSERTGHLLGVIEEHSKEGGRVIRRQAFMRPEAGGLEWDVPLERVRPVRR
ncbi:hypothetical protein [Streptomyces sp. NBC_00102]|uniref:hypothetical protein n=1 Tax=Streptomyces sp. NBC_00102 TaxID=2975652 RepID=UPI0022580928|nr:hypothetical protein [Streptomyces sp. NBC_00102]MCX5399108.1 hypothetical protein [Streptomyces sp. NBC_00102]